MTSHQLAKALLELEDLPVTAHKHHVEDDVVISHVTVDVDSYLLEDESTPTFGRYISLS